MQIDAVMLAMLIPLVTALVEALKRIKAMAARPSWLPAVSVVAGLVVAGAAVLLWPPAGLAVRQLVGHWLIHGVAAGLAACGLYSAAAKPLLASLAGVAARLTGLKR